MATDEIPIIQILERGDASKQTMVPLPKALPLPPLTAPSSIRLRTEIMGLTSNVFTYCRLGEAAGYYNYHLLPDPSVLPEPFASSPSKYAMTNCWGYGRVLSSTLPSSVPEGSYLYGYLPISTLPQDLPISSSSSDIDNKRVVVTAPHRKNLMAFYQNYVLIRPGEPLHDILLRSSPPEDSLATDSLFGSMHQTAHLLANHVFATSEEGLINPYLPGMENSWTLERDADLSSSIVVCFAPGSKTSLDFAFDLSMRRRGGKDKDGQYPISVVGVASPSSIEFVRKTGLYDVVLDTSDAATMGDPRGALDAAVFPPGDNNNNENSKNHRVVVVDFGGRGGSALKFAVGLRESLKVAPGERAPADKLRMVRVGVEIGGGAAIDRSGGGDAGVKAFMEQVQKLTESVNGLQVNTADLKDRAAEKLPGGEREVEETAWRNWEEMKRKGREEGGNPVKGFKLIWGKGMRDVEEAWGRMVRDEVSGDTGLAFKL